MVDLYGEYRHKVDVKGRLALPAKFRKVLTSEELIVTIEPLDNECLYVFEPEDYQDWTKSFFDGEKAFDNNNREHIKLRRRLRARTMSVQLDAAGRIKLDASQAQAVGLDKDVVLIGSEGYFEIWDAKRWDDYSAENYN